MQCTFFNAAYSFAIVRWHYLWLYICYRIMQWGVILRNRQSYWQKTKGYKTLNWLGVVNNKQHALIMFSSVLLLQPAHTISFKFVPQCIRGVPLTADFAPDPKARVTGCVLFLGEKIFLLYKKFLVAFLCVSATFSRYNFMLLRHVQQREHWTVVWRIDLGNKPPLKDPLAPFRAIRTFLGNIVQMGWSLESIPHP